MIFATLPLDHKKIRLVTKQAAHSLQCQVPHHLGRHLTSIKACHHLCRLRSSIKACLHSGHHIKAWRLVQWATLQPLHSAFYHHNILWVAWVSQRWAVEAAVEVEDNLLSLKCQWVWGCQLSHLTVICTWLWDASPCNDASAWYESVDSTHFSIKKLFQPRLLRRRNIAPDGAIPLVHRRY